MEAKIDKGKGKGKGKGTVSIKVELYIGEDPEVKLTKRKEKDVKSGSTIKWKRHGKGFKLKKLKGDEDNFKNKKEDEGKITCDFETDANPPKDHPYTIKVLDDDGGEHTSDEKDPQITDGKAVIRN